MSKIVGTGAVAAMLGVTQRTVRTLAVQGRIPSAFRVTDTSAWRFDEARVRKWVSERERAVQTSAKEYRRRWTSPRSSGNLLDRAIAERQRALNKGRSKWRGQYPRK